jgi:sugar O-acyltransferase (sialic acid O-acetyltransferase NeuD family)
MNEIFIVGAGGLGREVRSWLPACLSSKSQWRIAGFLNDDLDALEAMAGYEDTPIVSTIRGFYPMPNHWLVMAIADPINKKAIVNLLIERNAKFLTVIHPTANVASSAKIGEGSILYPLSTVHCEASLGSFVVLNSYSNVGHDSSIGDWSTLSGHVDVTGRCRIGTSVFVGSNASVLPGTFVGDHAKIGACSCVVRSVKANTTVFGVPAKVQ